MCRSDALIGLSSTRTSASPGAKGGVGISASCNTLFGSPVSRKINAFINTSWVFRRRLPDASQSISESAAQIAPPQCSSFYEQEEHGNQNKNVNGRCDHSTYYRFSDGFHYVRPAACFPYVWGETKDDGGNSHK